MKKSLVLLVLFSSIYLTAQNDIRTIYGEAMQAYQAKNYIAFLKGFHQLDSLSPMNPTITYNLGAAYARNGEKELALMYGLKAVRMNTSLSPETDEDYAIVLSEDDRLTISALKAELNQEVKTGTVAFTNSEKDLHPESVAYDPKSGHFFLNSVRKGKILRYDPKKRTYTEFSSGHWAVMGMRVYNNHLWACEVATPEFIGYDEANEGKTALLQFELKSGKLLNRYELTGGHWLGDVLISKTGTVYASDSRAPIIYTLKNGQLEVFKDFTNDLYNLQGLAFSANERLMYISDYKIGLQVLDLESMTVQALADDTFLTKGTDGLYFYENSLIAIQNGVNPMRVTRYELSADGLSITNQVYLDKARPELGEPTLGVLVGNTLYYVANSPWGAHKDGKFIMDGLEDNLVMKVDLKE
jgi:sugar lactone lactonase YvrE